MPNVEFTTLLSCSDTAQTFASSDSSPVESHDSTISDAPPPPPPSKPRSRTRHYEVLPERFDPVAGERGVWVAVITQALMDALNRSPAPQAKIWKDQARQWLTEGGAQFVMVCELAGLDPSDIKRRAKKAIVSAKLWRAEPTKGLRYIERKTYRERLKKRTQAIHPKP